MAENKECDKAGCKAPADGAYCPKHQQEAADAVKDIVKDIKPKGKKR